MLYLQCLYVCFYFVTIYWQSLLTKGQQFLSGTSGPRVIICTDIARMGSRGTRGPPTRVWVLPSCRVPPLSCGCCCCHHCHCHQSGPRSGLATSGSSGAPDYPWHMCACEATKPTALASSWCLISCILHRSIGFHLQNTYYFKTKMIKNFKMMTEQEH